MNRDVVDGGEKVVPASNENCLVLEWQALQDATMIERIEPAATAARCGL